MAWIAAYLAVSALVFAAMVALTRRPILAALYGLFWLPVLFYAIAVGLLYGPGEEDMG